MQGRINGAGHRGQATIPHPPPPPPPPTPVRETQKIHKGKIVVRMT